jgi:predicted MarR family transcription regulator
MNVSTEVALPRICHQGTQPFSPELFVGNQVEILRKLRLLVFSERGLPKRWFDLRTKAGNKFGMLLWRQMDAACNEINFSLVLSYENIVHSLCLRPVAQATTNQVTDPVIAKIHAVSHSPLLS